MHISCYLVSPGSHFNILYSILSQFQQFVSCRSNPVSEVMLVNVRLFRISKWPTHRRFSQLVVPPFLSFQQQTLHANTYWSGLCIEQAWHTLRQFSSRCWTFSVYFIKPEMWRGLLSMIKRINCSSSTYATSTSENVPTVYCCRQMGDKMMISWPFAQWVWIRRSCGVSAWCNGKIRLMKRVGQG